MSEQLHNQRVTEKSRSGEKHGHLEINQSHPGVE